MHTASRAPDVIGEPLRRDARADHERGEERVAAAALRTTNPTDAAGCCGTDAAVITDEQAELFGAGLYGDERDELPDTALLASLGCGNPTAMADLHDGMTVLDLGSGGGIDILLSACRVAPTGTAFRHAGNASDQLAVGVLSGAGRLKTSVVCDIGE